MDPVFPTQFRHAAAVDAWDRWFRWRPGGVLRDTTVDETWDRVGRALAQGARDPRYWARRYATAFSQWKLLPCAAILRAAGTGEPIDADPPPGCAVNLEAFIVRRGLGPMLDEEALADHVALAVRMMDDARGLLPPATRDAGIGIIGLASALAAFGADYARAAARRMAQRWFAVLAQAGWEASAELADERGALFDGAQAEPAPLAPSWAGAPGRGLRFVRVTRISPQPALAQLAGTSDAIAPATPVRALAELKLRAALQPWIDEPIDHPLEPAASAPEARRRARLARRFGVPTGSAA